MKITACIINYNNEDWITEAIQSIQKQSLKVDDIILVDDASTDKSVEAMQKCAEYSNIPIKIIQHEYNKGPAAARNTAIKNADADALAFLDGDDVYYKTKVEKSMYYLSHFPTVGMVYSDYDTYENQKVTREYKHSFDLNLMRQTCLANSNSLIRRSVFDKVGLFNENIRGAEDYEMWIRISQQSMMIHIPENLFLYRMHGNNFTIQHRDQVVQNTQRLLNAFRSS